MTVIMVILVAVDIYLGGCYLFDVFNGNSTSIRGIWLIIGCFALAICAFCRFIFMNEKNHGTFSEKRAEKKSREAITENNNPAESEQKPSTEFDALLKSFSDNNKPAETKTVPTQNLPSKTIPKDIKLEDLLDYLFAFSKKHSDEAVSLHIFPSKENLSIVAFDIFLITSCKISEFKSNEAGMISRLFMLFENDSDFPTYKFTLKTSEKKNSEKQVYDQIVSEVKKYSKAHNVSFYIRDFGAEYKFN